MSDRVFTIDPANSLLRIRTRAKGMLARLAHDLEIAAPEVTGRATLIDPAWSAELVVPTRTLAIAGTLHGDRLDPGGLPPNDRADVEKRIRDEVLASERTITVSLQGAKRDTGEASLSIGTRPRVRVPVKLEVREMKDGAIFVRGTAELSLRALGVEEIRAPLGAFKVSDAVAVLVDLTLRAVKQD